MRSETELAEVARAVRLNAYAPYSGYRVGCVLETEDGRIFTGCNVENASYGLTMCAERVALGNAIAAGAKRFRRAVIASEGTVPAAPCGACRQALAEFAPDLEIRSVTNAREVRWRLGELLPARFALDERSADTEGGGA